MPEDMTNLEEARWICRELWDYLKENTLLDEVELPAELLARMNHDKRRYAWLLEDK